jgi:hypothetical protein
MAAAKYRGVGFIYLEIKQYFGNGFTVYEKCLIIICKMIYVLGV